MNERQKPHWALFSSLTIVWLIFDLVTKHWAFLGDNLSFQVHKPFIPNILVLRRVQNMGAVYGIGQGQNHLFLALSFVAVPVLIWLFLKGFRRHWWPAIGTALILAGAIGNLYDRAAFGYVRDFLEFDFVRFPVFNIADSGICVGVGMLIVELLFFSPDSEKKPESEPDGASA